MALVEVDMEDRREEGTLKIRLERKEASRAQGRQRSIQEIVKTAGLSHT